MTIFARPEYQSEFTRFLNEIKQQNPSIAQQQRDGRALLWDKDPIDLDRMHRTDTARVKCGGYVYE